MKDKVQKIREELARFKEETPIGLSEHENGVEHGRMEIINSLSLFLDSMQKEPVSNDFEMALAEMIDKAQTSVVEPLVIAAQWKDELIKLAKSEEPVSEDLEEAAKNYLYSNPTDKDCIEMFKAGAKYQKEQITANAVDAMVGLPYENKDGGYTQLIDFSKILPVGKHKLAIVIEED